MKPLSNILAKEVRELMTPATFIPVIIMAVLFASLGGFIGGIQDEATKMPKIGLVNLDDGEYSNAVVDYIGSIDEPIYSGDSIDEGLETVSSQGGVALLVIEPSFTDNITSNRSGTIKIYWIMYGAGALDSISSSVVDQVITMAATNLSTELIDAKADLSSSVILSPIGRNETTFYKGMTMEGVSPGAISSVMSSQQFIIPLVVMMIILMSGGMVIASMGLEKENKTLETLLTMPVKRRDIVVGKLAGAAVVGLVMAVVYMAGMGYYMSSLQSAMPIDLAEYGLVLNPLDYALLGLSLFLAVLGALALCMLLGAFARDYKSAQGLTMPVTFLAMVPFFILMMKDYNTLPLIGQAAVFLIPFSHPMMAMNNLMFDDYTLVLAGIAYQALFAAATMAASVWLFKKDMLVTGRKKREKRSGGLMWKGLGKR